MAHLRRRSGQGVSGSGGGGFASSRRPRPSGNNSGGGGSGGGRAPRSHVQTEQRRRDRINEGCALMVSGHWQNLCNLRLQCGIGSRG